MGLHDIVYIIVRPHCECLGVLECFMCGSGGSGVINKLSLKSNYLLRHDFALSILLFTKCYNVFKYSGHWFGGAGGGGY